MTTQPGDTPARTAALVLAMRMALFYGAVFLVVGAYMPYFPVWLDGRGFDARQIGIVLAAPMVARILFTPVVSFAADHIGNRRLVLIALGWGALLASLLFLRAQAFWTVLAIAVLHALFWTTVMPLTEALAMDSVRRAGLDYGRMRLWGSLTFIAASSGGGFAIERWGSPAALWLLILANLAVLVCAHALPAPTGRGVLREAIAVPPMRVRNALALARAPVFLLFLFTAATTQSAHAVYYAFGTLYWQSLGITAGVIGMLWATGVIAEIALFAVSGRAVAALGPARLLWLAALATVVRWAVTALSPPLWLLFPLQLLHGLTFGAAHLAAIHFIAKAVPEKGAGTAQGLYASVTSGLAMGGAITLAGPLYEALGGYAYFAMAGLGACSLAGAWALIRSWRGGALIRLG